MDQTFVGLNSRSLLLSALIAGVGVGLLSHIPLIACINCLLFAWVWGGGIGAVYLYRRYEHQPFVNTTQGLVLGALAGVVGAIIGGIVAAMFSGLSVATSSFLQNLAGENGSQIPTFLLNSGFSLIGVFVNIIIYAIFGAIGGLIATNLIWKNPPAGVMPPPPPYTPPPSGSNF